MSIFKNDESGFNLIQQERELLALDMLNEIEAEAMDVMSFKFLTLEEELKLIQSLPDFDPEI